MPDLRLNGESVRLSRQHSRLVCALVASGPDGLDTDQLLEELYGDDVPASRNQAIYSLVSRLGVDASQFIANDAGRYRVRADEVDAWEFLEETRQEDAELLLRGLGRWHGIPFSSIEVGPVVAAASESLRRQRSLAVETTCRVATVDQLHELEQQIRDAASDDPYNEPLAISVASALFRLRKRRDALSIIQACRANLRSDLGLDGSSELDGAELALLQDEDPLDEGTPALETPDAVRSPLPGLLTPRAAVFVGRDRELRSIEQAKADGVADSRGRVVVITGGAGMGKSELVSQFAAQTERFIIRVGDAGPTASAAYGEWVRALPEISADVDELAKAHDLGVALLVFWRSVERVLSELARAAPLLLVLEDLHDADEQSARLFGWLSSGSLPNGVLIVATTRPPGPGSPWADTVDSIRRSEGRGVATMIDLEPLPLDAIESMVSARFPDEPAARIHRFATQVHALSHGNPLVGSALIADAEAPDDLVTSSSMTVEDQHAHSVLNRVDGVVAGVLTNAGLIGTDFDLATLAELCEMTSSATLVHIETAMASGLVIEADELGRFRFDHVLTAEAFAQRASRTRRSQTYVQLSQAAGMTPANRVRYVRGAGSMLDEKTAIDLLLREAGSLAEAHAFSEAQAALEYATELASSDGRAPSHEILVKRAEAAARAGDFGRLRGYRQAAFESAEALGASAMAQAALVGLPASERAQGDVELVELLERIDADELTDPNERGEFLQQFVRAARLVDRVDLVPAIFDRVTREDIQSDEMWALFESERIVVENQLRHLPEATRELEGLIANLPPGVVRTRLRHRSFLTALMAQESDATTTRLDAARSEALDQPVPRIRWALELAEATLTQVGSLDSRVDSGAALETGFRLGISDAFDAYGAQAWQQLWIEERFEDALALLDGAHGMIAPNVGWQCAEGFAAAAIGQHERALRLLRAGADQLVEIPAGVWSTSAAALIVEAGERIELSEDVLRTAVDVLLPHSGAAIVLGVCAAYFGPADGFIGRGLRLLGDRDAPTHLDAARDQLERTGSTYWLERLRS